MLPLIVLTWNESGSNSCSVLTHSAFRVKAAEREIDAEQTLLEMNHRFAILH